VRILELACGTGRVLASLAQSLPSTTLVGVDSSSDMLGHAERRVAALPAAARERVFVPFGRVSPYLITLARRPDA
jgi:trans-aconitate methyltransferase